MVVAVSDGRAVGIPPNAGRWSRVAPMILVQVRFHDMSSQVFPVWSNIVLCAASDICRWLVVGVRWFPWQLDGWNTVDRSGNGWF